MRRLFRILSRRMTSLLRRSRVEADLDQEIQLHIAGLTREYILAGMSESEARSLAYREFGPVEVTKEQCRDMRRVRLVEDGARDLVYAFRQLRRSPVFATTAVLSLALGIGANTVVFSVLNALVLKPLPVAEPERIWSVNNSGQPANSFPNYRDIRDRNTVFESLFAYRITQMGLTGRDGSSRAWGYLVTGNYFETLGIQPALGRFFTPAEDAHPGASPYAVISYECWRNRFGSDPGIIGKEIRLNTGAYRVVAVAPPGFHGTEVFYRPEIFVPMMMQPQIETYSWLNTRNTFNTWMGGRSKPGVTVEQAEANLAAIAAQLAREHAVNEGMRLTLSAPGLAGSMLRSPTRAFGVALMFLASLVLLAACANLATLISARAGDRARELAIRMSIGAGRWRLVRQLSTESLALAALGAIAGGAMAAALLRALSTWRAPLDFPVQFDVTADWRVFAFTVLAAAVTGILFGIGPVIRVWRTDATAGLKGDAAAVRTGRVWLPRDLLLPVQLAFACLLVVASLVAVRGLVRSFETPLGFRPDGVAVVGYDLGLARYDKERGRSFQQRALEAMAALPGVESAAVASSVPLSIDQSTTTVFAEGTTDFRPRNRHGATYYLVSPSYLRTVGTTLIGGRDFTLRDNEASPFVAVVNRTFARRVTGTEAAVGRRFRWGPKGKDLVEIIGVVEDGKYETLTETPKETVFFSVLQSYSPTTVMLARTRRPVAEVAGEMRSTIGRLDPDIAVYSVGALRDILGLVYLPMRAAAIALGTFAGLALMLCVTGVYGLAAHTVSQRTKEIGIRMAVGARPKQILRFVFGRLGGLVAAGALIGVSLAIAGTDLLGRIVPDVTSRDPMIIAGSILLIAFVALIAAWHPARRALGLDPMQCLRHD
jgi:predicted permease